MSKFYLLLCLYFCLSSHLISQNDLYNPQPDIDLNLKKWQENIQSKIKNSNLSESPDGVFKITRYFFRRKSELNKQKEYVFRCKLILSDKYIHSLYIRKFVHSDFRLLVIQENDTTSAKTWYAKDFNSDQLLITGLEKAEIELILISKSKIQNLISLEAVASMFKISSPKNSDSCNVNVACQEGIDWYDQINSVVRLIVVKDSLAYFCSGSVVNNTANDCRPLVLTALHCGLKDSLGNKILPSQTDLNFYQIHFNYQSTDCYNNVPSTMQTMIGASLLGSSNDGGGITASDYMLLELQNPIPENYNVYYAGWDSRLIQHNSGVGIHHPSGDLKKISTFTNPPQLVSYSGLTSNSHLAVYWSSTQSGFGITEKGSSGSPLFNENKLIIGQLTGGLSACTSPFNEDYYGAMHYNWDQTTTLNSQDLKDLLDPENTNQTTLEGTYTPCILNIQNQKTFKAEIYPNPAKNYINIVSNKSDFEFTITNLNGIQAVDWQKSKGKVFKFHINQLPAGMYFIVVLNEKTKEKINHKLIKVN